MIELIKKKRDGKVLTKEDYTYIVNNFVSGVIPDYQMAAFLMAIFLKGLNNEETAILTDAMMRSGELIDLSEIKGVKVDKHSTGGVGDKTTLILAPLVAAAGVPVAKMSGRGLGHTGGTIDKLASIAGLSTDFSKEKFIELVKKNGIAVCGQNESLVPADKKIYALRDVTGTVGNVSLICSSIMSKKLACGADAIVIDIKVGSGAYMKTVEEADALAKIFIATGAKMGRKVVAVISAMEEPLGFAIGNSLEVIEAIETLQGNGPEDLTQLCLDLGVEMLLLSGVTKTKNESEELLKSLIDSGAAFEKFKSFVHAQGGDVQMIEQTDLLPKSPYSEVIKCEKEGFVTKLDALSIGNASVVLGAGRATKESEIDYGAGILLKKKVGDYVKKDEPLAILYSNVNNNFAKAKSLMVDAYQINNDKPSKSPLIYKIVK